MLSADVCLGEEKEVLTAMGLTAMVGVRGLSVLGFFDHTKASERYAVVSVEHGGLTREWYVPYYYRRTDVRIDSRSELVEYLKKVAPILNDKRVEAFKVKTTKSLKDIFGKNANVTLPIFKKLLDACGEWVWNKKFVSSNPQRRIQDIKESGFTIATKMENRKTYHMLMPFDRVQAPTYEMIPPKVRKAIFDALNGIDAYSGKPATISVLPDHKFPEIRWEKETAESNGGLTPLDMVCKFQLIPEYVNQMKREVCRKCFQSGCRGKFSNIDFYYQGGEKWPSNVPTTGVAARVGCVGCFWYDMNEWRKALNKLIKEAK